MVYCLSKYVLWPLFSLFVRKINGLENIPEKPCIFVSNHQSYADGALLIMLIAWHKNRKIYALATNEKFTGLFWNLIFNHFGAIRVNGSVEKALQKLKEGHDLAIFPEGGRCYIEQIQPVTHKGLGIIVVKTKTQVVPVGIDTYHFWNRFHILPNFKNNIAINIGKPIIFKQKSGSRAINNVITQTMTEVKHLARISHNQAIA